MSGGPQGQGTGGAACAPVAGARRGGRGGGQVCPTHRGKGAEPEPGGLEDFGRTRRRMLRRARAGAGRPVGGAAVVREKPAAAGGSGGRALGVFRSRPGREGCEGETGLEARLTPGFGWNTSDDGVHRGELWRLQAAGWGAMGCAGSRAWPVASGTLEGREVSGPWSRKPGPAAACLTFPGLETQGREWPASSQPDTVPRAPCALRLPRCHGAADSASSSSRCAGETCPLQPPLSPQSPAPAHGDVARWRDTTSGAGQPSRLLGSGPAGHGRGHAGVWSSHRDSGTVARLLC